MTTSLELGAMTVSWLCGGEFELDGGTMFGPVPKVLWEKKYPPDEENYIKMLNAPLLVQTAGHTLLIDTGLGSKLTARQKQIFRVYRDWNLVDDLAEKGIAREDVDVVILTHADFDHAGGVVMTGTSGRPELTFPQARHILQQREWEDVRRPNIRTVHTYWPENFTGLEKSGLLEIVDGDAEIVPGIRVRLTGGHTRGHQLVEMEGTSDCAVHLGDLFPTHAHANPLWVMAYDNFPMEVVELKQQLLSRYRKKQYWFTFYHDVFMKFCRLDERGAVLP